MENLTPRERLHLAIKENNDELGEGEGAYKWTKSQIKESYFYGVNRAKEALERTLTEINESYFEGSTHHLVQVGTPTSKWLKKIDLGLVALKFKMVSRN